MNRSGVNYDNVIIKLLLYGQSLLYQVNYVIHKKLINLCMQSFIEYNTLYISLINFGHNRCCMENLIIWMGVFEEKFHLAPIDHSKQWLKKITPCESPCKKDTIFSNYIQIVTLVILYCIVIWYFSASLRTYTMSRKAPSLPNFHFLPNQTGNTR